MPYPRTPKTQTKVQKDLFTISLTLGYRMGASEFKDLVEELISIVEEKEDVTEVMIGTGGGANGLLELTVIGTGLVNDDDEDEEF